MQAWEVQRQARVVAAQSPRNARVRSAAGRIWRARTRLEAVRDARTSRVCPETKRRLLNSRIPGVAGRWVEVKRMQQEAGPS